MSHLLSRLYQKQFPTAATRIPGVKARSLSLAKGMTTSGRKAIHGEQLEPARVGAHVHLHLRVYVHKLPSYLFLF